MNLPRKNWLVWMKLKACSNKTEKNPGAPEFATEKEMNPVFLSSYSCNFFYNSADIWEQNCSTSPKNDDISNIAVLSHLPQPLCLKAMNNFSIEQISSISKQERMFFMILLTFNGSDLCFVNCDAKTVSYTTITGLHGK